MWRFAGLVAACVLSVDSTPPSGVGAAVPEDKVAQITDACNAEISKAVHDIRERYVKKLAELESNAIRAGDLTTASAARDQLKAMHDGGGSLDWSRVEGTWAVHYDNDAVHTYRIAIDGRVEFAEEKATLKLERRGADIVIDFGGGKVERIRPVIETDMFKDGTYPAGSPRNRGKGTPSSN